MSLFQDRYEAGRALATRLLADVDRPDVIVLGLPRGGVPVAFEVARTLRAPMDVYLVRKLGVPGNEELAMGAVTSGGDVVINTEVVEALKIPYAFIEAIARHEMEEIARQERLYRDGRTPPRLEGRRIILVDDGVATGSTIIAAAKTLRGQNPSSIVIAAPVVADATVPALKQVADDVVFVEAPERFFAVGQWYSDFTPTTDEEVRALLATDETRPARDGEPRSVAILSDGLLLHGDLTAPPDPAGIVIFAHGAGSSRWSPRNRLVAKMLQDAGFATLLFDLLTEEEERDEAMTGHLRFDVGLLARRLLDATDWIKRERSTSGLPTGYFGASTGAAAALVAAAERGGDVAAVVSRGGRPDLAGSALSRVRAPTLLIVGGDDPLVLDLNRQALGHLAGPKRLEILPGASHLFEEPGALARVGELAVQWFEDHLATAEAATASSSAREARQRGAEPAD
jgi:putative phosphoribosyl transferase